MAEYWRSLLTRPAENLRALADFAEEALFVLDERGTVRTANHAAKQLCTQPLIGLSLARGPAFA